MADLKFRRFCCYGPPSAHPSVGEPSGLSNGLSNGEVGTSMTGIGAGTNILSGFLPDLICCRRGMGRRGSWKGGSQPKAQPRLLVLVSLLMGCQRCRITDQGAQGRNTSNPRQQNSRFAGHILTSGVSRAG